VTKSAERVAEGARRRIFQWIHRADSTLTSAASSSTALDGCNKNHFSLAMRLASGKNLLFRHV
jgi:hypothetical protein